MRIKKFQEGGEAPMGEPMPQEQQPNEEQVMQQIAQMAGEIIQQLGPEAAAMLAQAIMEMLQGGNQAAPAEQQFMRKGGKLMKCGAKMKKKAKGGKC